MTDERDDAEQPDGVMALSFISALDDAELRLASFHAVATTNGAADFGNRLATAQVLYQWLMGEEDDEESAEELPSETPQEECSRKH